MFDCIEPAKLIPRQWEIIHKGMESPLNTTELTILHFPLMFSMQVQDNPIIPNQYLTTYYIWVSRDEWYGITIASDTPKMEPYTRVFKQIGFLQKNPIPLEDKPLHIHFANPLLLNKVAGKDYKCIYPIARYERTLFLFVDLGFKDREEFHILF